jgi:hypothetical protein
MVLHLFTLLLSAQPPYWQQRISYTIAASLDEAAGTLRGTQRVLYRNNSPDTLVTLSFHLYLNAFRPGSRWAEADSIEGRRRFNDLRDPDFGMNQVANVRIAGQPAVPIYPFAPDSTIVRFPLPSPLRPGDSAVVELDWVARPSTVPRRQGRRGRAFDFAQWYPRVVGYDKHGWQEQPLYPAGEFYGDFGDFTVALDVPEDQVIGATGVPICGDPGWEGANQNPANPVEYRRDAYPASPLDLTCRASRSGRKTVVWRAEDVHHFAISIRPDYRYEGGRFGNTVVHVLYQPGDEKTWGGGIAVGRTEVALRWLDGLFGPYPWPQLTNVHRLEGGGTEFPMMMHNGSADLGLILHEGGHNYLMGILANNEWREGFLDEGFTTFQSAWFFEERGSAGWYEAMERQVLELDLDGWSEPVSYPSHRYRDFDTYGAMIYTKGAVFFFQLREIVGPDLMRRILRAYYDRWKLKHVDEAAFREVAEEVSGRDLSTFFGQWLHGTGLYDYSVGAVKSRRREDGSWLSRIEIKRNQPGVFPVEILVRSRTDSITTRTDGRAARDWIEVVTRDRPSEVMVDPRARAHDWNMLNNRKTRGLLGWGRRARQSTHLDRVFSTRSYRDRVSQALLPTVWYNDAGGVTVGVRRRGNYLGRFDRGTIELTVPIRRCCSDRPILDWYFRLRDPTWARAPLLSTSFETFRVEGRHGAAVGFERRHRGHLGFGSTTSWGAGLRWVATSDTDYLDPGLYDNAGTVEGNWFVRTRDRRGAWTVTGQGSAGAGVEYRNRGSGLNSTDRYDVQGYLRLTGEITARRPVASRSTVAVRLFGGWVHGGATEPVRQRWFFLPGADPYQLLANPFLRSRDALLTGDVQYHAPGGPGVRGLERDVAVTGVAALTVELDRSVRHRPRAQLFRDTRLALFGDLALTDGFFSHHGSGNLTGDAGLGIRVSHTVGQTDFVTRLDLPVLVTHPDRAIGRGGTAGPADGRFRLRWVFSFSPAF